MHNIPISKNTTKVIDKIVNSNNIPNTILFYNDYKNIGLATAINFISNLKRNKEKPYPQTPKFTVFVKNSSPDFVETCPCGSRWLAL